MAQHPRWIVREWHDTKVDVACFGVCGPGLMPARFPHKKPLRKDIPASPSPPPHTTKSSKKAAIRVVSFWNRAPAARSNAPPPVVRPSATI
jgi:hypothetical protein